MTPATLVERLRGIVRVPVNDGAGLLDGKDFFERSFPTSNLAREAADEIERLTAAPGDAGWQEPTSIPQIKPRTMREFVVAVYRQHSGKVYTFAATYLNAYGLVYEDGCPKGDGCEGACRDDGCPTTGWFSQTGEEDDATTYYSLNLKDGDRLMGWRELPQWTEAVTRQDRGGAAV